MPDHKDRSIARTPRSGGSGVQLDPVQCGPGGSAAEAAVDWRREFQILATALGHQWLSSDALILLHHMLQKHSHPEAIREYEQAVILNRKKSTHDFMG